MNRKNKILFVFGTRPEAIKMAPVIKKFKECEPEFRVKVCVTAQHRHMLDDVLTLFNIKPDHDLNIMQEGQTLTHITVETLKRLEKILIAENPDLVLVHGDTTTTFAATLAAFYKKIPTGHIEAGLRTYDKSQPYPEEANRVLTDALCELHFAPTKTAKHALLKESISPDKIFITGNTVIDAFFFALKKNKDFTNRTLRTLFNSQLLTSSTQLILLTCHRRENFGKPIENIFNAIKYIAQKYQVKVIYPVHPNPDVKIPATKILSKAKNVILTEPVNYFDLARLMKKSYFIITDSGGIQEEAPSLGKPVLVLREVSERPEAVKAGVAKVIGTEFLRVKSEVEKLLTDKIAYKKMARGINPYGDGKASERIINAIRFYFKLTKSRPDEFRPQ